MYEVDITPSARRQLKKLPKSVQPLVLAAIETLAAEPRPDGVKKLKASKDLYRIRIQEYRILYEIGDRTLIVVIVKVGHRRDVYE